MIAFNYLIQYNRSGQRDIKQKNVSFWDEQSGGLIVNHKTFLLLAIATQV